MLIFSRNTLIDTLRSNALLDIWASLSLVKLIPQINHHTGISKTNCYLALGESIFKKIKWSYGLKHSCQNIWMLNEDSTDEASTGKQKWDRGDL